MVLPYNLNRFGGGRKPRPYYCEVEYIETPATSSNTSYFQTNMLPSVGTSITMIVQPTDISTRRITGASGTQGQGQGATFVEITATGKWGCGTAGTIAADTTKIQKVKMKFNLNSHDLYVDDTLALTYNLNIPHTTDPYFWGLGAVTSSTSIRMPAKWYRAYQEDGNGNIIHDLIPVLDWDMVPAFYDKVTKTLFYKTQIVGAGDVSYGRQVHYVEYLKGQDVASATYIDTGFKPTTNTKVRCIVAGEQMGLYKNITYYGARISAGASNNFALLNFQNTGQLRFDRGNYVGSGNSGEVLPNTFYEIIQDKGNNYVDGVKVSESTSIFVNVNYSLYIFGINENGSYVRGAVWTEDKKSFKLFQIYENDVLVRDYLPAVDENGVGFMFDKVEHKIYDNAGNGAFSYPDVELEYLESTASGDSIDLGVKSDWTKDFDIKGAFITNRANNRILLLGNYANDQSYYDFNIEVNDSKLRVWRNNTINKYTSTLVIANTLINYSFIYNNQTGDYSFESDFGDITGNIATSGGTSVYNEKIFYDNRTSTGVFKPYKMCFLDYNNGTTSLKIRPVIHNGVFCVYDEVSETYPTISGTFTGKIKEKK